MAKVVDNRPRNSQHRKQILEMFNPSNLRNELNLDSVHSGSDVDSVHSVDDHLDDTSDFAKWALKKAPIDQDVRKPLQISDSPLSGYDIGVTRLNKTDDTITPSSLCIPSSASLPSFNTPQTSLRRSRMSKGRPSGLFTPAAKLREKQRAGLNMGLRLSDFSPSKMVSSTPIRINDTKISKLRRTEQNTFDNLPSNPFERLTNGKENHSINNKSDRTLRSHDVSSDVALKTLVPGTQPNNTLIPESQDVPESQETVPETQENQTHENVPETEEFVPETEEYVPETEEYVPETQEDE